MKAAAPLLFGYWHAVEATRVPYGRTHRRAYLCRCVCGVEREVLAASLESERSRHCGCQTKHRRTHGESKGAARTKEYKAWSDALNRCRNPDYKQWADYGGRGIYVCLEWQGPEGFKAFLAHMGRAPSKAHTLERVDNDKGYTSYNCIWATRYVQAYNKRGAGNRNSKGQFIGLQEEGKHRG